MTDIIYLVIIIVFFLLAVAYLAACERLKKGAGDNEY